MMAAMWHRGPDDEGLFVTPPGARLGPWGAAVGMRRLSIIDLHGGHQPVFNEEQDVAVVFNGEIYNFQELRLALEARGHVFRTRSDTEVIVHAYETWGEDCVHHLRGMFAFAVVDLRQGPAARTASPDPNATPRVFLARDRLGIKRSEEHTSELQSLRHLVCRLLLEKKNVPNRHIDYVIAHDTHPRDELQQAQV